MMKKIFVGLMFFLLGVPPVEALTLINNTVNHVAITVNGNSGQVKKQAIVDYQPPKMKLPLVIHASGIRRNGKKFSCRITKHDMHATVVLPEDCPNFIPED